MVSIKAGDVCQKFQAKLIGDPTFEITSVGDPKSAQWGTACFVTSPKYIKVVENSSAGFWVMKEEFYEKLDPTVKTKKVFAITPEPYLFFIKVMGLFFPDFKAKPGIHPMAFVHPEAKVSALAQIDAFANVEKGAVVSDGVILQSGCHIGEDARIGEGTIIYSGAKIYHRCIIGKRNTIHSGAVIGSDGFGFVKAQEKQIKVPQVGRVVTNDDVEVGANSTIDRGTFEDTIIGYGVKIDNLVQIGHNCIIGDHSILCAFVGIAGNTTTGKNVLFSGKAATKGHLKIGDNVSIGGDTGITKDVPSNSVMKGYPAMSLNEFLKVQALMIKLPDIYKRVMSLEKKFLKGP